MDVEQSYPPRSQQQCRNDDKDSAATHTLLAQQQQQHQRRVDANGDSNLTSTDGSLADKHPFHDFPQHWHLRKAHRALPFFAHTHFTFHDPVTGAVLKWSNRDQRKGRYPRVADHALGKDAVKKPRLRLWAWEWYDVSWHAAFWFLLGSMVWVCNGFCLIIPVFTNRQEDKFTAHLTVVASWLALAGGILFEIGSFFLIWDSLNSKRSAELGKEQSMHGHLHALVTGRCHLGPFRSMLRRRHVSAQLLSHGHSAAAATAGGAHRHSNGQSVGANGHGSTYTHSNGTGPAIGNGYDAHIGNGNGLANSNGLAVRPVAVGLGEEDVRVDVNALRPGSNVPWQLSSRVLAMAGSPAGAACGEIRNPIAPAVPPAGAPTVQLVLHPEAKLAGSENLSSSSSSSSSSWHPDESVPAWRWIGWEPRNIGFMASFFQLCGATIFLISVITGSPGVLAVESTSNKPLWDGVFWSPQVVGSVFFIMSSYLFMVETQKRWWAPRPFSLGWHVGFWNLIGAVGFFLSGVFGYWGPPGYIYLDYGVLLSTWWGSCAFLIGSYAQLVECVNKHP